VFVVGVATQAAAQIRSRDLGTLGGGQSSAQAVNARGQVIGESSTVDGEAMLAGLSTVAQAQSSSKGTTMIDVGVAPGTFSSIPEAMNNQGDIVGQASLSQYLYVRMIPFLWTKEGGFERILGETLGVAVAVNDRRDVVGTYEASDGSTHGFLWSRHLGVIDLGYFRPTGINDRGTIVGECYDGVRSWACTWQDGHLTWLAVAGYGMYASSINNKDEVVGFYHSQEGPNVAFIWSPGIGLSTFAPRGHATAINDHGLVVGWEDDGVSPEIPIVWQTRPEQLTLYPLREQESPRGQVVAVNNNGVALLSVWYWPRLWNLRTRTEVPLCYPATGTACEGAEFLYAKDINDRGQVVASFFTTKWLTKEEFYYEERTVILIPAALQALSPVADAFVRAGAASAKNFGTATTVRVKKGVAAENTRRGYVKFDIRDIDKIGKATLRLRGRVSNASTRRVRVGIFRVSNQSWDEQTVTWGTKPAYGPLLGIVKVKETAPQWVEIDVTAFVRAEQQAGRGTISLALLSLEHTSAYASFDSRESGASGPQLVITP